MSDYTQVTFFAPKDALPSGNPSKLIKGTEIDPELSAIATAIATKYDSADVADNTQAAAATNDAVLMTPAKVKHLLENATFDLATGVTKDGANLVLSTRSIVSGAGLTGGATLAADVTLAVGAGVGITVNADDVALDTAHVRNVDHSAVSISAGGALTGGGTIAASRTITLDVNGLVEETSVAGSTDFVLLYDTSSGTHKKAKPDNVSAAFGGFVPNARQIISGNGLTGGGDLSADRTLNVGAGTGISVAADTVGLDTASTRNTDHAAVSISGGTSLTGGGTIDASRTLTLVNDSASPGNDFYYGTNSAGTKGWYSKFPGYASNYSAAGQSVTSSTTLVAYTPVTHSSVPAGTYRVKAIGNGTNNGGAGGQRITINGTNVQNDTSSLAGFISSTSALLEVGSAAGTINETGITGTWNFVIDGYIVLTATGTIELQIAQSSSNATAFTLSAARLTIERVA